MRIPLIIVAFLAFLLVFSGVQVHALSSGPVAIPNFFRNYDCANYLNLQHQGYVDSDTSYSERVITQLNASMINNTAGVKMQAASGGHLSLYAQLEYKGTFSDNITMSDGTTHLITVNTAPLSVVFVNYGTSVVVQMDGNATISWNVYLITPVYVYIDVFIPTDEQQYELLGCVGELPGLTP